MLSWVLAWPLIMQMPLFLIQEIQLNRHTKNLKNNNHLKQQFYEKVIGNH